ncbi:glycoside hydrolase family 97 catalytic domain-containing protein [Pelagicoccus sp. SDUM812002]|uniref:glycoside hydrolase family 97 protein n=1 Tax=Pelagicoccus sp. SDUM812002 TaxID=3041266 RepID=UPI00280E848F|nr:glycoside hydrolase family 97 catalytic domain-containing protein [Pelagicoccus sp. SDUM812002]MDQ8184323.1 glycoside hydrolase family 97 catalytic domain-containing protein [Pelagicoccus sp. SDUM812002]
MKIPFYCSAAIALGFANLSAYEVKSPEGSLQVDLELDGGKLYYEVNYKDTLVLEKSPLGLETSIGSFASGLKEDGSEILLIEESYELPHGKVSQVDYVANELTARYRNVNGDLMEVLVRVADHDAAFAYRISSEENVRLIVESEATGFDFPAGTTAFLSQQAKAGTGWMGTKPSYEEGYLMDVPVGTTAPSGLGFTYPGLFRFGEDAWAMVSETGVSSKYAGTRLGNPTEDGLYLVTFPEPDENGGIGASTVASSLPMTTPWRTITVGETLAPIVESTVATDVVEPLYEGAASLKPGRATWSWLLWQDQSMNEKDQRTFIDLAADIGFEYILIDALWDGNLGREKLAELVAYANSKDVDVLLWYNSNGYWNNAPQGPRNRLDSAPARQQEMAWLQSIGVKGLKVDFFGGDKQVTMKLYEDILTDGNRYGLNMNFHGATLPRGWERMYPNHMTSEAVTASENLVFSQGFADGEAWRSTVMTLVRNPVAAMDYGPVVLNNRFSGDPESGNIRRTTDAFQLATSVLFFSGIQHYGITPRVFEEQPEYVIDFLREVPAVWDETRFVDGYPGKHVVLARRSGDRWYLAASNGEDSEKTLSLNVPFLAGETLSLIHDKAGEQRSGFSEVSVQADGQITLSLEPQGGAVLFHQK